MKTQSQSLTSEHLLRSILWCVLLSVAYFVRKWKVHFASPCFQARMMPVAKATTIAQVTGLSCELRPVIGLSTAWGVELRGWGSAVERFDWLAGWHMQEPQQTFCGER